MRLLTFNEDASRDTLEHGVKGNDGNSIIFERTAADVSIQKKIHDAIWRALPAPDEMPPVDMPQTVVLRFQIPTRSTSSKIGTHRIAAIKGGETIAAIFQAVKDGFKLSRKDQAPYDYIRLGQEKGH